jgi:uncharacterized protein
MFSRLMPREGKFFDLFNAHAQQIVIGAKSLVALMDAFWSARDQVPHHIRVIDEAETRADEITHEVIGLLHKTFITPLDRDEIHQLINGMDDIIDLIQDISETVTLYDISSVTSEMRTLAVSSLSCVERVKVAVGMLSNLDNGQTILSICREISALETEADRVMRSAMSKLFRDEPDVRQVLKLKHIYEILETVTDRCDDVANTIEGIVLENS